MFCPKCGIENPDNGKFCRGCGVNLTNVLAVVDGDLEYAYGGFVENSYSEIYSSGVRNVVLGFGFGLVSMLLFAMQGNTILWVLFMIPAFCLLASGIGRILKADGLKKEKKARATTIQTPTLSQNYPISALPPTQTDYVSPVANYKTKDLVVPSVTEETTKHLK